MMDMITKTRKHFMTLMMLVTAVIIAAALVSVYFVTYSNQEASNRKRLNSFEEIVVTDNGIVSFGEKTSDAVTVQRVIPDIGVHFSMLTNKQGNVISILSAIEKLDKRFYEEAAEIAWLGKNYGKVTLIGRTWQYAVSPAVTSIALDDKQQKRDSDETYQIRFVDITESRQMLRELAVTLSIIGATLMLFFFFFSLFFSKRAVAPLREVLKKQQQFVADASHELKTPVSIIKANLSVLDANGGESIDSQREWLDNIDIGADRMGKLIRDLLALSKIEGADSAILPVEVQLGKLVQESIEVMDLMIKDKSLAVDVDCGDATIHSDSDRVRQAVDVVLDNAIKYANKGGTICVTAANDRKYCCLSVSNTGNGINPEDLEKIFDRFYRADGARTSDGSYGLGLSIVQTVMRQLGGFITAESIPGESATFILRFPK